MNRGADPQQRRKEQDEEEELVKEKLNGEGKRVGEQSPTRESHGQFLRVPRQQIGAQPERETKKEKLHDKHEMILPPVK